MSFPEPVVPNFVVGGAPKCGTTSICGWLADHPEARCSTRKEPFYLLDAGERLLDPDLNYQRDGLAGYSRCFDSPPKPGEKVLFEGTTLYLYQRTAREVLCGLPHPPKMLFVVRDPVRRVYSNFQYFSNAKATQKVGLSFSEWIDKIEAGDSFGGDTQQALSLVHSDYGRWLRPWLDGMPAGNIKIWIFEEVMREPAQHMRELCRWLGIQAEFYDAYPFPHLNSTFKVKYFWLHRLGRRWAAHVADGALRRTLRRLYRYVNTGAVDKPDEQALGVLKSLRAQLIPVVQDMETLLGRPLPEWR